MFQCCTAVFPTQTVGKMQQMFNHRHGFGGVQVRNLFLLKRGFLLFVGWVYNMLTIVGTISIKKIKNNYLPILTEDKILL